MIRYLRIVFHKDGLHDLRHIEDAYTDTRDELEPDTIFKSCGDVFNERRKSEICLVINSVDISIPVICMEKFNGNLPLNWNFIPTNHKLVLER